MNARYAGYVDSGTQWLGEIPAHWRVARLNQLATAWTSNVDKHSVGGQPPVRLCNYTDVYKNDAIVDGMDFMVATATPEQIARFRLRRGDTIITKDSETADDIGIPAFVDYEADDLICGYHLAMVRPQPDVVAPRFLFWAMSAKPTLGQWEVLASGVTRVGIRSTDLTKAAMALPSLSEQRAIADFLDSETARIDALVAEQLGLVEVLRERRSAVIYQAATKGLDFSVPIINSGVDWLGVVPAHWTVATLRRVGRFLTGTTPPGASDESFESAGEVGWARPEDLQRRVLPTKRLSKAGESEVRIVRDAVLICGIGATVGKVGFAEGRCSSNQQLTALITAQSGVFWYYALLAARAELVALSTGNTLPILNNERLAQLRVAIPPVKEQERIAAYLDEQTEKIDALIAEAEGIVAVAKERRSALITAAVTGQIDVQGEVA